MQIKCNTRQCTDNASTPNNHDDETDEATLITNGNLISPPSTHVSLIAHALSGDSDFRFRYVQ